MREISFVSKNKENYYSDTANNNTDPDQNNNKNLLLSYKDY